MTDDFRRQKRRKTEQLIIVIDSLTLKQLGLVTDLSESGMMIISSIIIEPDSLFQCELIFPRNVANIGSINVGIQELWSESDSRNGQHIVGFRFIDISHENRILIRDWVNEPGSNYA